MHKAVMERAQRELISASAWIRQAVRARLQTEPPEDKFRSANEQCAKKFLPAATKLYTLLAARPPRFMSLEKYLELRVRTTELAAQCEEIIAAPARTADYKKPFAAIFAYSLITELLFPHNRAFDKKARCRRSQCFILRDCLPVI